MTAALRSPRVALRPARPVDVSFPALGSKVRLLATGVTARLEVAAAGDEILDYHRRLSRFLPGSELCHLNADPRPVVPASPLLRSAVQAGLWAAELSGGLVDPCLLDALESAGYRKSYERPAASLRPAGPYREARPHPAACWREVRIDEVAGTIVRPPGLRLDLGGSGKGHVADLVAGRFERSREWIVDCGGDIRLGAAREIHIEHPLRERPAARLRVPAGAVATSSVVSRAWRRDDGRATHHLLDPSTGEPVRTGLLSASALAATTLHAETLAKMAVLRGPCAARDLLAEHGGVLVHEDGLVETIGAALEAAA